jgi:hypothetical protein
MMIDIMVRDWNIRIRRAIEHGRRDYNCFSITKTAVAAQY